jgi:hypothetical protein
MSNERGDETSAEVLSLPKEGMATKVRRRVDKKNTALLLLRV